MLSLGAPVPGLTGLESLMAAQPAEPVPEAVEGGDMLYSSGTTGGVLGDAPLEQQLLAFGREHLGSIKCPRRVDFRDDMPREPTGKLLKRKLRDEYWSGRESRL